MAEYQKLVRYLSLQCLILSSPENGSIMNTRIKGRLGKIECNIFMMTRIVRPFFEFFNFGVIFLNYRIHMLNH